MFQAIPFLRKTWTEARVVNILESTGNIRHLWIQPVKRISYKPGQNITLSLPHATNKSEQHRTYSIANAPNDEGLIQLCISYVEGGKGSNYLFHDIKVNSLVKIRGAGGKFTLPKKIKTDLVFICMGSALAPARSMIQHIFQAHIPHHKIHLIYGSRSKEGQLCVKEFAGLAIQHEEFKYSFTFSREANASSSTKRKYVHDIYLELYQKVRQNVLFYVSGSQSMIEETLENLLNLGYNRRQIIYDMG